METHNALVNLGKELNKIDTIKSNKEEHLNTVMGKIKEFNIEEIDYTDSLDSLVLKHKQKLDFNKYENASLLNQKNIISDYEKNIEILVLTLIAVYILQDKLKETDKELELSKETEEELNEQYNDSIEEVEELEKKVTTLEYNNKKNIILMVTFFIIYNYFLVFSLGDFTNHVSFCIIFTYSILTFFSIYTYILIGSIFVNFMIYNKYYKEKND